MTDNSRQVAIMSTAAVIGGILGFVAGLFVLSPTILIPIGVVVGVAIGLSFARNMKPVQPHGRSGAV